ncbi:LacI family DNA-binding transcriptional regulator [Bifidobacterium platyrrhinorum]|uniref:LacI family DNA-binding transcriptional regulator n=1 Tax=Bifidobacterium platyrrhinorum TaxID=2661628 RepID=A0A6L9SX57_9BIFI|nr:LacI family DNA-binding transcriptional regulator [Bifidobacterium platyrrhinorum]NEG56052.1 LacI family DNA-binding transcriptional regulator [Bifidobacterium platyrrhinorum]
MGKVTIKDVAQEAGVSKATVSYVLSGSDLIAEKTAQKVRAAAAKLGYSVNHAARMLATDRTNTIGVFAPPHRAGYFSLSLGGYLYSLSDAAREAGYDTMLFTDGNGVEALRKAVGTKRIDGAVLMEVSEGDERLEAVRRLGLPSVTLGMSEPDSGVDAVDTDFESAARVLVRNLASHGHRDVLLVGWPEWMYAKGVNYAVRFREAAEAEARRHGMALTVVCARNEALGSARELSAALHEHPDATAMIVHNDAVMMGMNQTLRELGVDVPGDLSVEVVVPDQMGVGMRVPYTGVDIDLDAVAERAVDVLKRRIARPDRPVVRELVQQPLADLGSVRSL